jgi:hypothetical protein
MEADVKLPAILITALLAVLAGSAFAAKPTSDPRGSHPPAAGPNAAPPADIPPAAAVPDEAPPGEPAGDDSDEGSDEGSKPYEIPPALGVKACQELKHTGGNAFGQCIAATARGLAHPGLSASKACKSLRSRRRTAHASRAFTVCKRAVKKTRRSRHAARAA